MKHISFLNGIFKKFYVSVLVLRRRQQNLLILALTFKSLTDVEPGWAVVPAPEASTHSDARHRGSVNTGETNQTKYNIQITLFDSKIN